MKFITKHSLYLLIFTIIVAISSCTIHRGSISNSVVEKPVKYEDIAIGVSQANKFFGLGGISHDALIYEAKCELVRNRRLKPQEQYNNFTIDIKHSNWLIYSQVKVSVIADVVKILDHKTEDVYSEEYLKKIIEGNSTNKLFELGDSILLKDGIDGTIISIIDDKIVRIAYKTESGNIKTKRISMDKIYSMNKSYMGYNIGDYYFSIPGYSGEVIDNAKIIGLGLKSFLGKDRKNTLKTFKYKK
ncbi:MAG: hypothetical protein PF517_01060 [Salinivirgaceae bacterium]|jgi:hypothetical protein|nr:hypothetical protein [Salinivirgaceae bacterium]